MFERLTVPARQAINTAQELARASGCDDVGPVHLLAGLIHGDSVAARLLQDRLDPEDLSRAVRRLPPRSRPGPGENLAAVIASALGVAAAQGKSWVGTASVVVALVALGPPSLIEVATGLGLDLDELAAIARNADETYEHNTGSGEDLAGTAGWAVTVGATDPAVAWSDQRR